MNKTWNGCDGRELCGNDKRRQNLSTWESVQGIQNGTEQIVWHPSWHRNRPRYFSRVTCDIKWTDGILDCSTLFHCHNYHHRTLAFESRGVVPISVLAPSFQTKMVYVKIDSSTAHQLNPANVSSIVWWMVTQGWDWHMGSKVVTTAQFWVMGNCDVRNIKRKQARIMRKFCKYTYIQSTYWSRD